MSGTSQVTQLPWMSLPVASGLGNLTSLEQHPGHIVNNGQQSAVLHASVMPFFVQKSSLCIGKLSLTGVSNTIRGATRHQLCSFFEHRSKGGGGHFDVQKFWSKFCMILKAFWQHKIDIKRLFKGRNVKILGWICHSFHRFTHYFVKLCRDRRLRAFSKNSKILASSILSFPCLSQILSSSPEGNIVQQDKTYDQIDH